MRRWLHWNCVLRRLQICVSCIFGLSEPGNRHGTNDDRLQHWVRIRRASALEPWVQRAPSASRFSPPAILLRKPRSCQSSLSTGNWPSGEAHATRERPRSRHAEPAARCGFPGWHMPPVRGFMRLSGEAHATRERPRSRHEEPATPCGSVAPPCGL